MVPVNGGNNEALLRIHMPFMEQLVPVLYPVKLHASSSVLTIAAPLQIGPAPNEDMYGSETTHIFSSSNEGDAYFEISGSQTSSEVKILHAVCLPKIECTVQPYKVIRKDYPRPGDNKSPVGLPTRKQLEDRLNEIYGPQMNVHFTVNDFISLGPLNFDVGAGAIYETQNEKYKSFKNDFAFEVFQAQDKVTDEENAIYQTAQAAGGPINDPAVIKIYFMPALILAYEPFQTVNGIAKPVRKSAFISESLITPSNPDAVEDVVMNITGTVNHEIGHLGLGNGAATCLFHPRERGIIPDPDGFPLRRKSDDMSRLMWWDGDERTGELLIKDEWSKFRDSKNL